MQGVLMEHQFTNTALSSQASGNPGDDTVFIYGKPDFNKDSEINVTINRYSENPPYAYLSGSRAQ